ncbi:MAG: FixH family protein [Acidobacteria bacterium]|nr:FixH family protein [Acidobacteriota bacterium]
MRNKLFLLFTCLLLIFLAACNDTPANHGAGTATGTPPAQASSVASTGKVFGSGKAGDVTATLSNALGQLKDGDNDFTVEFRNAAGQPVDVGAITMFIDMPAMPPTMPYMKNNVKLVTTNTPGIYQATVHLEMAGTWNVHVTYKGSAGEGKIEFPIHLK